MRKLQKTSRGGNLEKEEKLLKMQESISSINQKHNSTRTVAEDLEKELKEQLPAAKAGLIISVGEKAQGNSFGSFVN